MYRGGHQTHTAKPHKRHAYGVIVHSSTSPLGGSQCHTARTLLLCSFAPLSTMRMLFRVRLSWFRPCGALMIMLSRSPTMAGESLSVDFWPSSSGACACGLVSSDRLRSLERRLEHRKAKVAPVSSRHHFACASNSPAELDHEARPDGSGKKGSRCDVLIWLQLTARSHWRCSPSAFPLPVDSPALPPAPLQSPGQPARTDEQQAINHCTHAAALLSRSRHRQHESTAPPLQRKHTQAEEQH